MSVKGTEDGCYPIDYGVIVERVPIRGVFEAFGIKNNLEGIWTNQKGPDMTKFTEWLMEMYPKTEDYVYIQNLLSNSGNRQLWMWVKPDPQAFLDQMKDFDEMMED